VCVCVRACVCVCMCVCVDMCGREGVDGSVNVYCLLMLCGCIMHCIGASYLR